MAKRGSKKATALWLIAAFLVLAVVAYGASLGDSDGNSVASAESDISSANISDVSSSETGNNTSEQPEESDSATVSEVSTDIPSDAGELAVWFFDVGQGDCIIIKTPEEKFVVIDAGPNGCGDQILKFLKSQGAEKLDLLVLTHPHADHIGSAKEVVNGIPIDKIIMSYAVHTSKTFLNLVDAINDKDITPLLPEPGDRYDIGSVEFTVMAPYEYEYDNLNNYSVVLMMRYGDKRFLFTGDTEIPNEREMLAADSELPVRCDVLKVAHHGSSTSSLDAFIKAASPEYAVIMCKQGNSYNHPHTETLDTLNKYKVNVLRTDLSGTITFLTDGKSLKIETEK